MASKDIPIIFSGAMVRALLEGRKTQTRRVFVPPPPFDVGDDISVEIATGSIKLPYAVGDRLWVRESVAYINNSEFAQPSYWQYRADTNGQDFPGDWPPETKDDPDRPRWRPSIHMPREASRLTLICDGVKAERLQAISREDAIAEGATARPNSSGFGSQYEGWSMDWSKVGQFSKYATGGPGPLQECDVSLSTPQSAFGAYINELHGGPRWNFNGKVPLWDQDPLVVAPSFRVIKANIDAPEARAAA